MLISLFCSQQSYNRDMFLFLYILLIVASTLTSLKKHHEPSAISGKSILYLNRHQTDEWRGWMQVGVLPDFFSSVSSVIFSYLYHIGFQERLDCDDILNACCIFSCVLAAQ